MLDMVKTALRISGDAFDDELQLLIDSSIAEMKGLGVVIAVDEAGDPTDTQTQTAVIAYCKWQFGDHDNAERWRDIYHTKLAQLKTMTGHTVWPTEEA